VSWFLTSRIGRAFSALGLAISLAITIYVTGWRQSSKATEIAGLKGYIKAQERVNEAEILTDPDAVLDRLRINGQLRD
jgi:hypothetical protein